MNENDSNEEKNNQELRHYFHIGLTIFLTASCCMLFFFLLWRFQGFAEISKKVISTAQPILFGLALAYLLNPIANFFEERFLSFLRKKIKMKSERRMRKLARGLSVTFSVLFLLLIIGILLAMLIPSVTHSVVTLMDTMPGHIESFTSWLENVFHGENPLTKVIEDLVKQITAFMEEWIQKDLLPTVQAYLGQITSTVISFLRTVLNFIIGIIVAVYVLTTKETLLGQSKKIIYAIFKPKRGNSIIAIVRKSNEIFGGFIIGKILDSVIIGVICYIGCLILRMPSAILIATIIGVTNIIPFFGPIIGAVPCVLLVLIQSPIHALTLLIFILVLQQVDGNIIGPKILGNSTGLSSFWVMFAILIAGGMWGFFGMLFGVPVFAVLYHLIRKAVAYGLERRRLPSSTSEYVYMVQVDEESNGLVYETEEERRAKKARKKKKDSKFVKWIHDMFGRMKKNHEKK